MQKIDRTIGPSPARFNQPNVPIIWILNRPSSTVRMNERPRLPRTITRYSDTRVRYYLIIRECCNTFRGCVDKNGRANFLFDDRYRIEEN